ncbi:MAG: adenylate/guanylate cyclase domain-containing protein [Elusimicrobia bacterium]|nr:adenylate/guanylate cyclase domain-containing protein [Elusimicrobiota bacterium]
MPLITQVGAGASRDRLEKLIAERLKPGADKGAVDVRIWQLFGEEWAVMYTDLSGFSRKVVEFGIIHFLQVIAESERIFVPCIDRHDGVLLKVEGDSLMVLFRSPGKAIECAIEMQGAAKAYNEDRPDKEKILLCVGVGFGKVLKIGDHDVFGAEVNAASKLGEDTAKAWEILVTDSAKDVASQLSGISFEPIETVPPGARAAYKVIYKEAL